MYIAAAHWLFSLQLVGLLGWFAVLYLLEMCKRQRAAIVAGLLAITIAIAGAHSYQELKQQVITTQLPSPPLFLSNTIAYPTMINKDQAQKLLSEWLSTSLSHPSSTLALLHTAQLARWLDQDQEAMVLEKKARSQDPIFVCKSIEDAGGRRRIACE